jgi:hypothetical protein
MHQANVVPLKKCTIPPCAAAQAIFWCVALKDGWARTYAVHQADANRRKPSKPVASFMASKLLNELRTHLYGDFNGEVAHLASRRSFNEEAEIGNGWQWHGRRAHP